MGKFRSNDRNRAKLDDWFGSPALDQLEELTFDSGHMRSLRTSVLRLVPTLRVAKFRKTSQDVYHGMVIEDTRALERLLVVDQEGPTRINVISALKLTVVGYSSDKYSELVIGSTPVQIQQPPSTSPSTN